MSNPAGTWIATHEIAAPLGAGFSDRNHTRIGVRRQYDVSPDGQRFLMVRPVGVGRERRLILVRNALHGLESIK